ncbi:type II TA system antitoxin MqsA family protein [Burkholderia cenocepacia]|uniref:type II TA system antitoxin MqsA family protein n=1 Tax=Burkholderia cenocepacia TaxID=95486 RepID=UPI001B8E3246|nr:type II TA system antitoxin MqsA family protein [Burkholderia cenocepacia]MBR8135166.1 type II toxin-antitoxin system MqsA family antitoxin [Burkholderia cenocepacia]
MTENIHCPYCGSRETESRTIFESLSTKYGKGTYACALTHCMTCTKEFETAEQSALNEKHASELRLRLKNQGRTLDGAAIRIIREQIGFTQREAANIFGGGEVAFSRYESDSVIMGQAAETLLKIMYIWPETIKMAMDVQKKNFEEIRNIKSKLSFEYNINIKSATKAKVSNNDFILRFYTRTPKKQQFQNRREASLHVKEEMFANGIIAKFQKEHTNGPTNSTYNELPTTQH